MRRFLAATIAFALLSPAALAGGSGKEADLLYDSAKLQLEHGEAAQALTLMRQSLELEATLNRPTSFVRTKSALAAILVANRQFDEAKKIYSEVLAYTAEHKMVEDKISTTISLGSLSMQQGQAAEAAKYYKEAQQEAHSYNLQPVELNALTNLSVAERSLNHLNEAMACLLQALPIAEGSGSDSAAGKLYLELGRVEADLGKVKEAQDSYVKARAHFEKDFDTAQQGRAMTALGQLLLSKERYAEAEAQLLEAQKILAEEANSTESQDKVLAKGLLIDCLTSLGACLTAQGRLHDAQQILTEAMNEANSFKNPDRKRGVYSELGYLLLVQGLTEKALEKYTAAYELLPKDARPSKIRAVLHTDLAMCYKALGQLDVAISNYEKALTILTQLNDVPSQALAANNLAVAYLDSGKMQDFDRVWQKAASLFIASKDKKGEAVLSYNLGQSKLFRGMALESQADYQNSLNLMRSLGDSAGIGQALRGLGLAYLMSGQAAKAIECYNEALNLKSATSEARWDCQLGLGKAYKALGQNDKALLCFQDAANLAESERGQLSRDTFKTFNLDLRQDCFYELVSLLIEQNKTEEALTVAERSRARAFADLLAARLGNVSHSLDASGSSDPASSITLNSKPLPKNIIASKNSQSEDAIANATAQALSTAQIKELISNHGSACIEYYALPDKLIIWVVDAGGSVHMLPPVAISRKQLNAKAADLYNTIIAQPKGLEEIKKNGIARQAKLKEMHKLLIYPAERLLSSAKQVIVVPHGALFLVPFAALMNAQNKFFVEEHTMSVVPAISVLQATAKLSYGANADNSLLAFGNPTSEMFASLGSLPYAEKEVQKTKEQFGNNAATVELGAQANRSLFVQKAPGTSVIHMACHGIINEEQPTLSGLVLAKDGEDDGFLTVKDILNLPALKSRLIVLSACQTGRGKITGDGVIGLSRAFIAAGSPSVIVSHWNVDDVIAEFQMEAFYKAFLSGQSKADSLRKAQMETISSMEGSMADLTNPAFIRANPRYWAAFQLIGEAK